MRCTLRGHRKAISTLSINPDGHILLSGGGPVFDILFGLIIICTIDEDGQIALWDMDGGVKLQDISCPIHGAIITSIWIPTSQGNVSAFAFGCADGSVQVYARPDHKVSDVDPLC
jgi:WD40 repeat protein